MSPGPVMERVYVTLKQRICQGAFHQGEHIDPGQLSRDLASSASPIRDALHRLEGERLVESHYPTGFRIPIWTEPDLRDAYRWNGEILGVLLGQADPAALIQAIADYGIVPDNLAGSTALLFERLARASANIEHLRAIIGLNERLHAVRQLEPGLIADSEHALATLVDAARQGAVSELRRAIAHYHKRRLHVVPALVAGLRSASDRQPR